MSKKGTSMPINEHSAFGENSASGIVIISATSTKIGTIIHANEEVEQILGYQRKELIGKNVNILMTRVIGKVHDRLIQRYFETAKPTVIEIKR
jgi:PAS domain S-box-containing protein